MTWLHRISVLLHRDELERKHEEELEFHLAMLERRNVEQEMPVADARALCQDEVRQSDDGA
jgi:hypothetical protein